MFVRKLIAFGLLMSAILLSGCNLSQSGAAAEIALNPPTLEVRPTRTPIPEINPTRTQIAAPTITVLGGNNSVAQPAAQVLEVGVVPTQLPPPNICSLRPSGTYDVNVRAGTSTDAAIQMVLKAGQYLQVVGRSANSWLKVSSGAGVYGWVAAKVVTLNGPCDNLPVEAAQALSAASSDIQSAPTLTPTPTGMFGFTMNIPLNRLITKMDVGSIPAGTTVMVTSTQFNGSEYLYSIMTADGRNETARDSQLAYSASGGNMPFPTPTQVVEITTATSSAPNVPTPLAVYSTELGMNVYRVKTTETVGNIPASTAVRVSSAQFNGTEWTYEVATKDGVFATALESQLAYIPNAGGGGPTPTTTPQVMELPIGVATSDVIIPNDLCTVTANTTTNIYAQPGSSTVVGILNPGPWSQVDASNGKGWYKVTIWTNGSQGWTTTSTVTLHGPCDKLPVE